MQQEEKQEVQLYYKNKQFKNQEQQGMDGEGRREEEKLRKPLIVKKEH